MKSPDPSELRGLFEKYRDTGDRRVRNQLVEAHIPLARRVARQFANRGEPLDDLIQVAQVGLLKAVERFDPERGVKFATFAEPTMSGELKRHFRDKTWSVRVSRRTQELHHAIRLAVDDLGHRHGRSPRIAEIAEHLDVSVDEVLSAMEARSAYQAESLSTPVGDEEGRTVEDQIGGVDPYLERSADRVTLSAALSVLPEREREIIRLRFEEHLTQSEIADRIGISQMHVSRLLRRTIDDLRGQLRTST